tara:strand:+ start:2229 stop:2486 length:258 start_codon:yes stop_codon:yes gene_type:complete
MEYTNCCGAPFGTPGWPDCDLCSDCHEHAEPMDETQDHGPPYSMANPTGEPVKRKIEIEITYEGKDKLHCENKESNDNPFGLDDL